MKQILSGLILAICAAGAFAYGSERGDVKINNSSYTVWSIYTSPVSSSRYGRSDLLGGSVIVPGYSKVVNFDVPDAQDSCLQDVRAVTKDGQKWERRMNICSTES